MRYCWNKWAGDLLQASGRRCPLSSSMRPSDHRSLSPFLVTLAPCHHRPCHASDLVGDRYIAAREREGSEGRSKASCAGKVTLVHSLRGEAARKTSPLSDQPRPRRTVPSPPRPTRIAMASETAECMLGHHRTFFGVALLALVIGATSHLR
jgi:hypothetical protein